ncbi:MAG: hypothetical protein WC966_00790 [Bradymonadales bacterium]|jgi:hypothetical protein
MSTKKKSLQNERMVHTNERLIGYTDLGIKVFLCENGGSIPHIHFIKANGQIGGISLREASYYSHDGMDATLNDAELEDMVKFLSGDVITL